MLESASGQQFISSIVCPSFSSICNGTYPGELAGLLASVHMATYLCLNHNIPNTIINVSCDNIQVLECFFQRDKYTRSSKQKHYNILSAMAGLLNLDIVQVQASHVYGHQDNTTSYENLDRRAQINVRMDTLAKLGNCQVQVG